MIRAAVYARFSSDLQSDRSIEDQIALCREVAKREGMAVVQTFQDRAISGASIVNRRGFQAMMNAARARQFDVILAENVDRISRDQADWHNARRDLDFLGITIHTATGRVSRIDGSLRALMGELYLETLAINVRRGLAGVIRDGRHAGGRAYGYRTVPGKPGEMEIDEDAAATVREIFTLYAGGKSPRSIANLLNKRKVPPPRGDHWNASTINGNLSRGHGILLNEIYAGRLVWNRTRWVKDPATGKRVPRINPPEQQHTADVPHLRIVDADLWGKVQALKQQRSHEAPAAAREPRRPLSGLLRCAFCGGGITSAGAKDGRQRLQCSNVRENGTCTNNRLVSRDLVEELVLSGLKEELGNPAAIAEFVKVYNQERTRLAKTEANDATRLERRAGEIERELKRLVAAIAQGVDVQTIMPTIKSLEAERAQIGAQLAALKEQPKVISLHPAVVEQYHKDVAELATLVTKHRDLSEARGLVDLIRRLVVSVVVHAKNGASTVRVEVQGRLAQLTFAGRSGVGIVGSGGGI